MGLVAHACRKQADQSLSKTNRTQSFDVIKCVRTDTITNGFIQAIATGNWKVQRFRMDRQGVTQVRRPRLPPPPRSLYEQLRGSESCKPLESVAAAAHATASQIALRVARPCARCLHTGAFAVVLHLVPGHDDEDQLAVREDAQGLGAKIAAGAHHQRHDKPVPAPRASHTVFPPPPGLAFLGLQPSQWGMICPADTPEGEACGLVKNLALLAHVTTDEEVREASTLISQTAGHMPPWLLCGAWVRSSFNTC